MSLDLSKIPNVRNYYLAEMLKVLENPVALRINFSAFGKSVKGQIFRFMAGDLRDGFTDSIPAYAKIETGAQVASFPPDLLPAHTNLIVLGKLPGKISAEYGNSIRLFRFNQRVSPTHPQWAVTVIHESVHAWLNAINSSLERIENEALAYISEHLYGLYVGMSFERQTFDTESPKSHLVARMIARTILIGNTPPKSFFDEFLTTYKKERGWK